MVALAPSPLEALPDSATYKHRSNQDLPIYILLRLTIRMQMLTTEKLEVYSLETSNPGPMVLDKVFTEPPQCYSWVRTRINSGPFIAPAED